MSFGEHILYFDKPTIGYCPVCDKPAIYNDVKGSWRRYKPLPFIFGGKNG